MKATPESLMLKVQRAEAHTIRIRNEIEGWAESQSESIYRDLEDDGRDHVYRVRVPRPFDDGWLVIFGEILYDLRSTLDHLAYAIVPLPDDRTEFPVTHPGQGRNNFLANSATKLPGLQQSKPRAWDIIEKLQPYQRASSDTPWSDRLWILHKLNIIDKHRYPPARTADLAHGIYGRNTGDPDPDFIPVADRLDFVEDNRVGTYRFSDPHPEIDLHAEFTLGVFFREVAPQGETVGETLWSLVHHVQTRVIDPLLTYL